MPAHAVDLETKQQANTWLLPPYSYSLRQIASELDGSSLFKRLRMWAVIVFFIFSEH